MNMQRAIAAAAGFTMLMMSGAGFAEAQSSDAEIKMALDAAYAKASTVTGGKNADYIPALAKVDSKIFGVALVTADGRVFTKGDVKSEVSIQSISKVFTLALVLDQSGSQVVEDNIGVDATGMPTRKASISGARRSAARLIPMSSAARAGSSTPTSSSRSDWPLVQ